MPRRRSATLQFNAIRLVGGLLPAALIEQIARQEAPGQKASDYGLPKTLRIQVAVDQAWSRARALWQEAMELSSRGEGTPWRVWFSSRLLREVFGWEDLESCTPRRIEEALYPISHQAFGGTVPALLTAVESGLLDQGSKAYGQDGRRRSPHSCLQECLNADDSSAWGVLCNGTTLRLLHDNPALVKPAYVQVELADILGGGLFDEFAVLWLLLQASRFQGDGEGRCRLDAWLELGQQSGERALNRLRDGVQSALEELGEGFLRHPDPANRELVRRLETGELSTIDFFRQVLRLVYRLLFLCSAEDRKLLFPPGVPLEIQQVYHEGYSLSRLRDLAIRSGAHEHQHSDLWKVQVLMFRELEKETGSELGLPALGGLFNQDRCADLDKAQLSNAALLAAVRAIGWFYDEPSQSRTRINYAAMNTEEFGSVYESLLELHPQIRPQGGALRFSLGGVAGSERKTSGSYYTPEDLVRLLILSALLPVIRERVGKATTMEEKEQALLAIRVLDPACGSGHFLLAAARRLGLELARILAADDEPGEDLRRHCLREVVAQCIYGVDKNPMAIELCKVALWIEAIEPGKPLGFLDAHIQCGDSLVGVLDPKVLEKGVPDGAYKPLTGDDKKVCSSLKKKNQSFAVKGQRDLFTQSAMVKVVPSASCFEDIQEDDLQGVRRKEQAYQAWRQDPAIQQELQRSDAYTAAFFLPKTGATQDHVPVSQNLDELAQGSLLSPAMAGAVAKAAEDFHFLHWHLAFPDAMRAGGFDCVLGNPPWERIKLQEKEFFATRSQEIANAPNKAAREQLIKALSAENASVADRTLMREFELAKREAEGSGEFIRCSGRFSLTAVGDLNTYDLFAEHFLDLISPDGRAGLIVPTGIATDNSTKAFFDAISSGNRLISLYDFRTGPGLFSEIGHQRFKFCLVTLGRSILTDFVFFALSVSELSEHRRHFTLEPDDFSLLNPNTRTCPIFRSKADAELTKKIYSSSQILSRDTDEDEPGDLKIRFTRMFDMTNDSHLFSTSAQLRAKGCRQEGSKWVNKSGEAWIPLYEAKMIGMSNYRFAGYSNSGNDSSERGYRVLPRTSITDLSDHKFENPPFYWVPEEEFNARRASCDTHGLLLALKDVTHATNERTVIGCLFPDSLATGNSIALVSSKIKNKALAAASLYSLNSIVCDFVAKSKVGGLHLNFFIVKQLPVPRPELYTSSDIEFLCSRILRLNAFTPRSYYYWDLLGLKEVSQPWAEVTREQISAEVDAYYAHLYGLSRDDVRYILDPSDLMGLDYPSETFRVLKNNEIRQFGEYRTVKRHRKLSHFRHPVHCLRLEASQS